MNIVKITDLIDYLKFGYTGDTIDLIYLLLWFVLVIVPAVKYIAKFIKGVMKNDK